MVTDSFYGDTWAGIFKLCSVSFDLTGPRVGPMGYCIFGSADCCPVKCGVMLITLAESQGSAEVTDAPRHLHSVCQCHQRSCTALGAVGG